MHTIRLRGPWEYVVLAHTVLSPDGQSLELPRDTTNPLPPPGKVTLPCDWGESLGDDFRGRVRYSRRFNRPTGLTDHSRIALAFELVDYFARITLNEQFLGELTLATSPAEFEITSLLRDTNLLLVEIDLPALLPNSSQLPRAAREQLPGGLVGLVQLVIED